MAVKVLAVSSTEMTFRYLMYEVSLTLDTFMDRSPLAKVYGKSDSRVTVIFVFKTGDADMGLIYVVDLTVVSRVRLRELETVRPLISIVGATESPALAVLSNADVRHTRVEVVETYGVQLVS